MQLSQAITRKSASNLALAFVLLPREKRDAMAALYAFCREVDDIADEDSVPVEERRAHLDLWRKDVRRACEGETPEIEVIGELQPFITRYRLPCRLFEELLDGVQMDLKVHRYGTYAELEEYCYRVASVVGLLSIEIFGYRDPQCRQYAVSLGKALQFTNILRDVRNDAERGRIYLPLEELVKHRVSAEEILQFQYSDRFYQLAQSMAQRARCFYFEARQALPAAERQTMLTAELMGSVYWRLLEKLERGRFDVFGPKPARLSKAQKVFLIFRTWYRSWTGALVPNYGTGH